MADSKDILELSRNLAPIFQELKNAARLMADASEKLSKTGLDKFTAEMKKSLKTQGLINDADEKAIKDAATLHKVLAKLEDQFAAIQKVEKEAEILKKKQLAGIKLSATAQAKADRASRDYIESKLAEHDITIDMIDAIKKGLPAIRDEAEARSKLIASTDGLTKSYEKHKAGVMESIKAFGSASNAVALTKKAFFQFYDQMNRLTSKGMLGALGQINAMAFKLSISAADLEEIMTKNRDVVNQMGGGLIGMQKFGDELADIRKDLKYLGEGATKAAARMYELSKRAGLQRKDGDSYFKNLKESNKQMKLFAGAFGDTVDEYANLMDSLNEESRNRGILNNLSKEDIFLSQKEQRERVQNLKFMGLNNQQIVEMNHRMSQLVNPESNDFAERATSSLNAQAAVQETIKMLMGSNKPGDQAQGMALQGSQGVLNRIYQEIANGNGDAAKQLAESEAGVEALKQLEKGIQATNRDGNQFNRAFRNNLLSNSSSINGLLRPTGADAASAEAGGRSVAKGAQAETIRQAEVLTASSGAAAENLDKMTQTVKKIEAILANPFVAAAIASVSALMALSGAALQASFALRKVGMGGLGGIPGSGPGAPGGTSSKIPGKGLKIGGATVASAVIGLGADYAADKLGRDTKAGAGADVLSSAASGAGLGALALGWTGIGAPIGAAIGGTLGAGYGLYQNRDILFKSSNPATVTSPTNSAATPATATGGKPKSGSNVDQFVSKYGAAAEAAGKKLGVDPKIILGQWGLETGWGKSVIPGTNNLGNIKDFSGKGVTAKDNMNGSVDKYRAYGSPEAFADDYVSLIKRKYPGAVGAGSPEAFAGALKSGGYAEDPNYVKSVSTAARMAGASTTSSSAPSMPVMPNMTPAAAPVAAPSGTSVSSSGSGGASGSEAITELKKQTGLLSTIAQTLGVSPSPAPNRNGYARDTAVVMSGVHG